MQTTLLSIAIAIILALLGALVGPHYVDWNHYRSQIEVRASRLVGLNVRVAGAIEVRVLPTPSLTLQRIEVVRPSDAGALKVQSLDIEFALGSLVRGELRASHAHFEGAEIQVGIDSAGRLDLPVPTMALDPDAISIERLNVANSRVILTNAVSGSRVVLENVQFTGDLRSLAGPVKGNGSVTNNGHRYPYQIAAARAGEGGGVRLRLNVNFVDQPLIADADAVVSIDKGSPRYEGTVQLARPGGTTANGVTEPWRMTTRVKGDVAAAGLDQIEFQYGADDQRAVRLRGKANLMLGRLPQLEAELTATQIDLDRVLELPEAVRRRPMMAIKAAIDRFVDSGQPPIPLKLNLRVDNVALAGAATTLQSVRGEIKSVDRAWNVDLLEFRAPGSAQVRLSGRLDADSKGLTFVGPAKIEARDARAFLTWLTEPPEPVAIAAGPLRAEGRLRLSGDAIGVDRFSLDGDRMSIEEGDVSYSMPSNDRPAHLKAVLKAADLDVDRLYSLAQGIFGESAFGGLSGGEVIVEAERGKVAGVEVKRADIAVTYDREAVAIKRFSLGDFGGAGVTLEGQILSRTSSPEGNITVDLNARALDGLTALLENIDPAVAAEFRRQATTFVPAKVRAKLVVSSQAFRGGAVPVRAALTLEGSVGVYRISLQGNADDIGDLAASGKLSQLATSKLSLTGTLKADDGSAVIELLRLAPFVVVDKRQGQIDLTAGGTFDGEMTVVGRVSAGGLEASTTGKVRLSGTDMPTAELEVKSLRANILNPQPSAPGRPVRVIPLTLLKGQIALTGERIELSGFEGRVAGTEVRGRLAIGRTPEQNLSGDLEFGEVVFPAVIATALGAPSDSGGAARVWPSEPFDRGLLDRLNGLITLKAGRVALGPNLAAKNVRGVVQIEQSTLSLKEIDGSLAGGQVAGDIAFERRPEGIALRARVKVSDADLAELIRGGPPPLAGRLALDMTLEGAGRSPVALVGSLDGNGTFSVKDGRIRRVDPGVFDAVVRGVDQGLPIDVPRVTERIEQVLGANGMVVPQTEGTIVVAAGQARLGNLVLRSENAELVLGGSVVLAEDLIDARMTLSSAGRTDGPVGSRPEIGISLKGPVDSPRRTLDVVNFTNWLHLREVEQNAKRIDLLESGRDLPLEAAVPRTPRTTATPPSPFARAPRASRTVPDSARAIVRPRSAPPLDIRPPASIR